MNTPLFIARRYLFSKKSVNAINIISGISMLGVFVGSAALIIILSIFNGFELLIVNMYSAFTPELRIEPTRGKSFILNDSLEAELRSDPRVLHYSDVLQEKVLLRYGGNQYIATLKGQSEMNDFSLADSVIQFGQYRLTDGFFNYAVVGAAVHAYLGIDITEKNRLVSVYSPRKNAVTSMNPSEEFNVRGILPAGVLKAQPQFDNLIIVPLNFARDVLGEEERISAIEIHLNKDVDETAFQQELQERLSTDFRVNNIAQQNPTLYKILNSEKWAIFFILTFILVIAIFNIIGSLTMLVIDKKKDIAVLKSLGASDSFIKNIFFSEGMFISLLGCVLGLAVGLIFCLLQEKYGLIAMEGTDLVNFFPVAIKGSDFLLVFCTVSLISAVASFVSSRLSVKGEEQLS